MDEKLETPGGNGKTPKEPAGPITSRDMDRADFFKWAAGLSIGGTCLLTAVAAAQAVSPPSRSIDGKTKMPPTALIAVSALTEGKPQLFEYGDDSVFITKQGDKVIALNAACPHVACKLHWDEGIRKYACPCHASFFDLQGTKLAGPALRNMDKALYKIEGGQVVVSGFDKPA